MLCIGLGERLHPLQRRRKRYDRKNSKNRSFLEGWTKSPGVLMDRCEGKHVFSIRGNSIEFVLNNGKDQWDQPFQTNEKRNNYEIQGPGSYHLKRGTICKQ